MIFKHGSSLAALSLLACMLAGSALAAPTWICTINQAVAVDEDGTIGPPELDGLAQPTFLRVDVDRKEITLLAPESRRGEISVIDEVHQGEGLWVFSGVQDYRAWSLLISDDGFMTMSVATDGAVWSVFGHALLEE